MADSALVAMELDSLQNVYSSVLHELEKVESCTAKNQSSILALPDASSEEVKMIKTQLRSRIDSIRIMRNKEVISL